MNQSPEANAPLIEMKDLHVGYGVRKVLSGIRASVAKGQFVSLLGPNGAGKTTLLRTLTRHLRKIGGEILLSGRPLESYRQKELAASLAVVLTTRLDTELFTGFEFAAMGRHPHTGLLGGLSGRDRDAVWESLRLVNAENLAHRPMNELSDGEKQKLYIARALAQEPKIIVLDEPTAHLDLKHQMEIMSLMAEFCKTRGITVVASLHDVGVAARVSDQVALVNGGAVVAWGSPEEVLDNDSLVNLYGITSASYDRRIGVMEMKYRPGPVRVFCVAGAGTGAALFRALARNRLRVDTGVLHTNDIDRCVADAMGIPAVTAPAFSIVTEEQCRKCRDPLDEADHVVDTGFPVGDANRLNLRLLEHALQSGRKILSLRRPDEYSRLGIDAGGHVLSTGNESSLLAALLEARDGKADGFGKARRPA